MKRLLSILFLSLLVNYCLAFSNEKTQDFYKQLKDICDSIKLSQSNRCVYEKLYFEYFPDTFDQLQEKYGFENLVSLSTNWLYSQEHIDQIFDLKCVPEIKLIEKLIRCSIDGKWEEETIGKFRNKLNTYINSNFDQFIKVLDSNFSDKEILGFLTFIVEGPFYNGNRTEQLKPILEKNKRIHNLLVKTDKILKEKKYY